MHPIQKAVVASASAAFFFPSGTAAEYISTGKYQPECYTPSNTLFGKLVENEGVELTVETDRLVGNVAGILVSKKTGDMLRADYGEASVNTVLNATIDGKMMRGYSNYAADSLSELASINEAASIVGNSEDITYKLRNLFNAEM